MPTVRSFLYLLACLPLIACASEGEPTEGHPVSSRRVPNPSCRAVPPPPPTGPVALELAFDEALDEPIPKAVHLVQHPVQDEVWFIALQDGQVLRLRAGESDSAEVVLDIAARLELKSSESGLVSFALHPEFEHNRHAFAVYSAKDEEDRFVSRLARFTWRDGAFDPSSERVRLDIPQGSPQHTGNHVAFGPDGYLYYAVGDDRGTDVNAQDPGIPKGKILRLDVDDAGDDLPYAIPPDNPFVDVPDAAPEVYALGFRNPWRFAFDSQSGDLYVGDVGQDLREEIDHITAGSNYGWPVLEGSECFEAESCDDEGFAAPLVDPPQPSLQSIVAGPVYHGGSISELSGRLLYADYVGGSVWSVDPAASTPDARMELEGAFSISSFAEGRDGSVYAVRYSVEDDGGIYRLVPNDPPPSDFPKRLSGTGCFDEAEPTQTAAGVVPFEPVAPLWSDGAEKRRFLALPDDGRIVVRGDGDFELPDGSVLIKHFGFEGKLHETRLLMRHEDEWSGYSYRWNEDQSEAELLDSAVDTVLPNGVRWHFPSRSECLECHTEAAGRTLGLEIAQLDHRSSVLDGQEDQQLRWLLDHDFFAPSRQTLSDLRGDVRALVDPFGDASLERRARAYLHSNCANCHRPDGPGRGDLDLRYTTTLSGTGGCDREPRTERLWGVGVWEEQRILAPGDPEASVVWLRMSLRGRFGMPPLGSELIHEPALELVGDWIESLEGCE